MEEETGEGGPAGGDRWNWLSRSMWIPLILLGVGILYLFASPVAYFVLENRGILTGDEMSRHLQGWLRPVEWAYQNVPPYRAFIDAVRMPLVGR